MNIEELREYCLSKKGVEETLPFGPDTLVFKVIGKDKKIYGPVSGAEIEQWLAEGRILATSLAQKVGYQEWKQLLHFAETHLP